jgi:hypothetical protein
MLGFKLRIDTDEALHDFKENRFLASDVKEIGYVVHTINMRSYTEAVSNGPATASLPALINSGK